MSLYFTLKTVENNKNKKSVKFQGDMLSFCDFIQVFAFTTNHHLRRFQFRSEQRRLRFRYGLVSAQDIHVLLPK